MVRVMSTDRAPPVDEAGPGRRFVGAFELAEPRLPMMLKEKLFDEFLEQECRVSAYVVNPGVPRGKFVSEKSFGHEPTVTAPSEPSFKDSHSAPSPVDEQAIIFDEHEPIGPP
jgi:hypothetical protein